MIYNRGLIILGSELNVIGVGFIIYGILTIRVLKIHFGKFYTQNFKYLVLATMFLSLPLMVRGLLDLVRGACKPFREWANDNFMFFNMFIYLVGTVLPLAFQLSSLIFGLIRKNKKEKFKLKFSEIDRDPTTQQSDSEKLSKKGSSSLMGTYTSGKSNDFFDPYLLGGESDDSDD